MLVKNLTSGGERKAAWKNYWQAGIGNIKIRPGRHFVWICYCFYYNGGFYSTLGENFGKLWGTRKNLVGSVDMLSLIWVIPRVLRVEWNFLLRCKGITYVHRLIWTLYFAQCPQSHSILLKTVFSFLSKWNSISYYMLFRKKYAY